MRFKQYIVFIFLLISSLAEAIDYRFTHLTSADGLSQSEVYTFLEDRNGFMWIGTLDGLNRYDGYSFEKFNTNKKITHSLSNNTVRCLAEDKFGNIWIGTDDGLNLYDQRKELICKVKIKTTYDKLSIWSILASDDYMLIGTNDGLWRCSNNSFDIDTIEKSFYKITKYCNKSCNNSTIRSLISSKNIGTWVVSECCISRIVFQPDEMEPFIIEDLPYDKPGGEFDIEEDAKGCIWIIGADKEILRYNPQTKKLQNITSSNSYLENFSRKYSSLSIDKSQKIWVSTSDNGLLCIDYDFEKDKITKVESIQNDPDNALGLNSNLISPTYISSTNMLWIGTIGSGVNILDPEIKKIDHYLLKSQYNQISNNNFIRAVMVDDQNRILVGTQNNGLFLIDRNTKQSHQLGFDNTTVFYISHYRDNRYFVCSNKGVSLIELNGSSFKILHSCQAFSYPTFYILHSKDDLYWCATWGGVIRIKVNDNKILFDDILNKSSAPALSSNNCRVLCVDESNNQLIVGTEGGGVNYIKLDIQDNPVEVKVYKSTESPNSLNNNYVRSIIQDKNKNIWIGTYEGLNKVVVDSHTGERSFKTFTKDDGLPNNMIQFIAEDDENNLWLGTNEGLSKFSINKESFMNYNMDDGLQSNEFSEHTVYKTKKGELIMGGINGINALYPEDFKNSKINPRTLITDLYLNNQHIKPGQVVDNEIPLVNSIIYTKTLVFEPQHRNIGFKFSAMIYPNAGKVKYAYKLEGFDEKWIHTDAQNRTVHYTNLRHGNYIFKVKATNTDGVWNDNPKTINIKIETPFYLSTVAIISYLIIFGLIFFYFSRYTVINLTTKRNLLLEKEHSEKIIKLDDERTRFFTNISHDLRTPLTLISEPLKDIMTDKSISGKLLDNLQLIKRNVKRLTDLVEQLLDFRKAEESSLMTKLETIDFILFTKNELSYFAYSAAKKGLKLTLESAEENMRIALDTRMIAKVYFNIISNAIKYTNDGEIKIIIRRVANKLLQSGSKITHNNYIQVEVIDTGIGISKDQEKQIFDRFYQGSQQNGSGYGIGLSHAKDLIEAHKGQIEAECNPKGGTIVRFFIPEIVVENATAALQVNDETVLDNNVFVIDESELIINPGFKNILLVEDNIEILNYVKSRLTNSYNVLVATNGVDGLTIASNKMPDLIVSDIMMPEMDGIEFCKAIKTNILTSHIPVILLTAKADLETKYKGIETGADDYISKPFEMEYLLIRIQNLLQSRENLRKVFQRSMVLEPAEITVTSVDEIFLSKLMIAIEEKMSDEHFTITSLETMLGMSHTTFYKKIKTLTGQSAQEFLLTFRIKRGYQILLENKGIRISEVAFMVGFSSPKYFTKCFKDVFGYAPSDIKHDKA